MLFHVTWRFVDTSEEGERRSLAVFPKWQPPEGAEFKGVYGFADNSGGVAIVEVDSAATIARTTAPWVPRLALEGRRYPSSSSKASMTEPDGWTSAGLFRSRAYSQTLR